MPYSDRIWVRPFVTVTLCTLLGAGCGAPKSAGPSGGPMGGGEKKPDLALEQPPDQNFMRVGTLAVLSADVPRQEAEQKGDGGPQKVGGTDKNTGAASSASPAPDPTVPVFTAKAADGKPSNEKKESVQGAVVDSAAGISEEEIRAVITKQSAAFRRCYDKGVSATPGFSGAVLLRIAISAQGSVAAVEVTGSTTKNQSVDTCVAEEIKRLQFPAKGSGAIVGFPIELGR